MILLSPIVLYTQLQGNLEKLKATAQSFVYLFIIVCIHLSIYFYVLLFTHLYTFFILLSLDLTISLFVYSIDVIR